MPAHDARYVLRFLSGPHAGTEVVLGLGTYVLGSAEQADLIVRDPEVAARHLLLDLGPGELSAQPQEARFFLDGREIVQDRVSISAFQVITAGFTNLALAPQGQPWPSIELPTLEQAARSSNESEDDDQQGPAEQSDISARAEQVHQVGPSQAHQAAPQTAAVNAEHTKRRALPVRLIWLLLPGLGLAIIGLWLFLLPSRSVPDAGQDIEKHPWMALSAVVEAGLRQSCITS